MNGNQDENQPDVDDVDLELVAYLDNELPPEEAARVEQRLAADGEYLNRLKQLERTWDMLEALPQTRAGEAFTRTTVALVAATAAGEVRQTEQVGVANRWWSSIAMGGGAIGLALIGFFVTYAVIDAPNRQLLGDLPVIEHLDEYRYADSVEFLEMLRDTKLFVEEDEDAI